MRYQTIDLFSGAGGLSYGFEQAGIEVTLAIEKDAWAVDTYKANHRNQNIIEADITTLDDAFFQPYQGRIDIVMGGPPCQGFSIASGNRRKPDDPRNLLYRHFLRVVSIVQPKVVLIENVKEIATYHLPDGTKIIDDIQDFFQKNDYRYDYKILNCRHYGIPQDRKRFLLLAVKKGLAEESFNLESLMKPYLLPEISFQEATSDLPFVLAKQFPDGTDLPYNQPPHNPYQEKMREGSDCIHNHIPMRHTDKTIQKFQFLLDHPDEPLPESLKPRVRSHADTVSNIAYHQNHRVLVGNKVSPTITASFYSSFIHPTQPRNLTIREAARIQSFPDSFQFYGKKTTLSKKLLAQKGRFDEMHLDQFNQVGNAVPPLMAKHLAELCMQFLSQRR